MTKRWVGSSLYFAKFFAKNGTFFRGAKCGEKWHFFREAKNGEKLYFSRCEMRRKMVQFRAVSWVEPAFRENFRENGTLFRGAKCGENGALLLAKNGEK
jgi:hypothetical protein